MRTKVLIGVLLCALCAHMTEACRGASLLSTGITNDEKFEILQVHNHLRSSVAQGQVHGQPKAQNMREMVWDDELAAKAQKWANQCTFQHDPNRYIDRFTMGQNLAIMWSTAPLSPTDGSFHSRIQNWFNEVQKYAWGANWSPKTGHYSQLVWGETNLVGCGFSYYKDVRRYNKLWVCNYGPGGNVVGSQPYEVGQPSCSSFGMAPSSRYSGLCITTSKLYGENNDIITQNTYTFKSERINPIVYKTVDSIKPAHAANPINTRTVAHPNAISPAAQRSTFSYRSTFGPTKAANVHKYNAYALFTTTTTTPPPTTTQPPTPPPTEAPLTLVELYQRALAAYQDPSQSYESAQFNYQIALQAYAAAYPSSPAAHKTASTSSYYSTTSRRTSGPYDWSAYY